MRMKKLTAFLRGFTLIEVIVVVAILLILAALLFPLGSSMVARGHTTKCSSNLRQIYLGLNQFLQDNNNRLPNLWNQQPVFTRVATFNTNQDALKSKNLSFILYKNYNIDPNIFICPVEQQNTNITTFYRRQNSIWAKDGAGTAVIKPFGDTQNFNSQQGVNLNLLYEQADGPPSHLIMFYDSVFPGVGYLREHPPHKGRQNFLFFDGHVETLTTDEVQERYPANRDFNK